MRYPDQQKWSAIAPASPIAVGRRLQLALPGISHRSGIQFRSTIDCGLSQFRGDVSCRPATEQIQALAKPCIFASWTSSSRASLLRPRKSHPASSPRGCTCVPSDAARRKVLLSGLKDRCQAAPRQDVHRFVVNRGAPELFPVTYLVKNRFTRREAQARCAFDRTAMSRHKPLKPINLLSLINCPLN